MPHPLWKDPILRLELCNNKAEPLHIRLNTESRPLRHGRLRGVGALTGCRGLPASIESRVAALEVWSYFRVHRGPGCLFQMVVWEICAFGLTLQAHVSILVSQQARFFWWPRFCVKDV